MIQQVRQALCFLPEGLSEQIGAISEISSVEEIRLRQGRPVGVFYRGKEHSLKTVATGQDIQTVIDLATMRSQYAVQEMLKQGYISIKGGHRLGVCGTGTYVHGELKSLKDISSLNLRIAKDVSGIANQVADHLWVHPSSVLIVGAPGSGKTTLLRDLIRQLSTRFRFRISVVDERMELAACVQGRAQFDLGALTDVLSGVHKAEGIEMLLRSMAPNWIALDEITADADARAILQGSYSGVRYLATAHAYRKEDLYSRPVYRLLVEGQVFQTLVLLNHNRTLRIEEL